MPLFKRRSKDPINKPRAIENGPLSTLKEFELISVGSMKIPVFSIVREISGLPIEEVKKLVENAPSIIPVKQSVAVEDNIQKLIDKGCKIKR